MRSKGAGAVGRRLARASVVVAVVTAAACSSSSSHTSAARATKPAADLVHQVAVTTMTFVDRHHVTPSWKQQRQLPQRTLPTTIVYPTDRAGAPYPLIAFSHGFGSSAEGYIALLRYWATQGFVVAAPTFPLTNSKTPGGADEGDFTNQPGDISFVITSVLAASAQKSGPLAGMIDPNEIGAAGHSNGAITTLGLVANTCCFDARVKAAEVLAGTQSASFTGGHYDFARTPPILFVHGSADALIPYGDAVLAYNAAHGPKALLTVKGGDHSSAAGYTASSRAAVQHTTADFFRAYLEGDAVARNRLDADGTTAATTITSALADGATATLPTIPVPKLNLKATVTPEHALHDGQTVTVTWSGYSKGKTVNVLECAMLPTGALSEAACGFTNAVLLHPDPTGAATIPFKIVTGKVGNGTCDFPHECTIVVNNAGSVDPKSSVLIGITFAHS